MRIPLSKDAGPRRLGATVRGVMQGVSIVVVALLVPSFWLFRASRAVEEFPHAG